MIEIIALQEYTDKYISLYEGQIRNIAPWLAEELIEKGVVAIHGSSEGLPAVTAEEDGGKVLTVDSETGKWVAKEPTGGSSADSRFFIITVDSQDFFDKTIEEIEEALNEDKILILYFRIEDAQHENFIREVFTDYKAVWIMNPTEQHPEGEKYLDQVLFKSTQVISSAYVETVYITINGTGQITRSVENTGTFE